MFAGVSQAQETSAVEADRPTTEEPFAKPTQVLPCRPTIACTADIVPADTLELELGYSQRRASGTKLAHAAQALAKYSLTDRLQLQLGSNNVFAMQAGTQTRAFDGAFAIAKVLLVKQGDAMPAIAVSGMLGAPTTQIADAAVKTYDTNFWVYASKDVLGFHADLNLGLDLLGVDQRVSPQSLATLAVSHEIAWGLGAMVETYGFHGGAPYAQNDAGFLSALSYQVVPEMMFDAGVDVAMYQDTRTATFFAGLTFVPIDAIARGVRKNPARRSAGLVMTGATPMPGQ